MSPVIWRQMLTAEVLKLRRNRGLMAFTLLLTVGMAVIFFGYDAIRHASDPATYGPAGGTTSFLHAVRAIGALLGALAAILIGTEAGTADLSSGVFRDLVSTGRSRLALFAVRAPAAIIVTLAFTLSALALSIAASFVFAGGQATPDLSLILQSVGWIVLANSVLAIVATGVGAVTGSRALTLTALIGWEAIVSQILMNVPSLGSARDGLITASLGQLVPGPGGIDGVNLSMSSTVAAVVLAAWVAAALAVGAWRTATSDA